MTGHTSASFQAPPSASINTWTGTDATRTIAGGGSATLRFEFEANADKAGAYSITVNFDKGCSVEFKPGPGPNACTSGYKPQVVTMMYTNTNCITPGVCNDQASDKWKVIGDTAGATPVYIVATDGGSLKYFEGSVALGATFDINAMNAGQTLLKSNTYVMIYSDSTKTTLLQSIQIHTSCSQPLKVGDQFGRLLVDDLALIKK